MDWISYLFDAPTQDWIRFFLFLCGIVLFIFIAEKARHHLGWPPEVNRKLVHVLTGLLIVSSIFSFTSNRPLVWMAVLFMGINFYGIRTGRLKGMHGTGRPSYGTVFYPMTFLILVLTAWPSARAVLILSVLILALADAAAAVIGETMEKPHIYTLGTERKSLEGSAGMFVTTFVLVVILLPHLDRLDHLRVIPVMAAAIALATALMATALEALSIRGSDNLTAPLGAAFVLHFMTTNGIETNVRFMAGLFLALLTAFLAYRTRLLTGSGSTGTFVLATIIFGIGGWPWAVPILTFFLLSSLLSKAGKAHKAQFGLIFEKSSTRDLGQVMANGAVAGSAILLSYFFPHPGWYIAYLGSLAAVNADTWATELGVFSKVPPRSIAGFRTVSPGTSGGITLLGLISAFSGSAVIALSGWIAAPAGVSLSPSGPLFWLIIAAGLFASLVDSLLGATLQAQFRCPACGKITEKRIHCRGTSTTLASGRLWLNNDWVNAFCSLSGLLFTWMGLRFL